ncbi:histone methylation DOT1 family protein [Chlamydia psittaci 10_743_SC13]|nr:class I SAM-dependent methyltransferase [Chlamydia avium]EPP37575.1 histone methylation DOT1 family protein [Chlamydia psittaci 10_743_SC13]
MRSLYIRYPKLLLYDLAKFIYSLLKNPYAQLRRSKQSSLLHGGNVYGETPWSVLNRISKEFGITSKDIVYDLGCGLGKTCFWFSHIIGCQVIGVDNQSAFVCFASCLHKWLSSHPALFFQESFFEIQLEQASCVYFYGSSYSLKVLKRVLGVCKSMSSGSVVISISFPLDSLPHGDEYFFTEKSCDVLFPWGKTRAYKNIRK